MKNWKAWFWVVAVFLAGVALGLVGGHLLALKKTREVVRNPEVRRQMIVKRLSRKLDLTDDQRKSIEAIIADAQVSIRDLRQEVQPRFEDVIQNAERQISEVLTAEQQEEFRKFMAERKRLWRPD
jgi:Spy/CpxP family protein refolding chaperone